MLDHKQRHLIQSWLGLADQPGTDAYNRFMALWIAFNAYCYAHYAPDAYRERADLSRSRDLQDIPPEEQAVEGTIQRAQERVTINLTKPNRIRIVIQERYTEDHIFSAFARHHADTYNQLLGKESFREQLDQLHHALRKPNGHHYVINMARAGQHDLAADVHEMAQRGIIILFEDTNSLQVLKDVLYQIRCNIFHGEKAPGNLNDDRIANAATPVLRELLRASLEKEEMEGG